MLINQAAWHTHLPTIRAREETGAPALKFIPVSPPSCSLPLCPMSQPKAIFWFCQANAMPTLADPDYLTCQLSPSVVHLADYIPVHDTSLLRQVLNS